MCHLTLSWTKHFKQSIHNFSIMFFMGKLSVAKLGAVMSPPRYACPFDSNKLKAWDLGA
jgi:hypothetical protein